MANKVNEKTIAISPRQSLVKRMNVYFGPETGDENHPFSSQKSVLVREIPDNSVDILRKVGKGGTVKVTFFEDKSVEVYDSGSGIPVELSHTHEGTPASSLYLSLGVLNAGTNYENAQDVAGTNGVGGSGAQMLSQYMKVEVYRDKQIYRLDFKEGKPGIFDENDKFKPIKDLTYLKVEKDNRPKEEKKIFPTGTKIRFKIDDKLFRSEYDYEIDYLLDIMKGTSFLDGSIKFDITDYQHKTEDGEPTRYFFNYGGGLEHIVDLQATNKLIPISTITNSAHYIDKSVDVSNGKAVVVKIDKEIKVEATFTYENDYEYKVESFVNTLKTRKNGIHESAFTDSLTKVFNNKLQSMRGYLSKNEKNLPIVQDYLEGLCLAVSVRVPEPEFTSQTKEALGGKETLKVLKKMYTESLEEWVNARKNQESVKVIADKVMAAYSIRIKRTAEVEVKRQKNKLERVTRMPAKLVDCEFTHTEYSELFIVEGDSAKTPLKAARNSQYQALLPLRGKFLNVMKASTKKMLDSEVVQDIVKCLDAGIGEDFSIENARYRKVFIATDADPDGAQISNLIVVLFWTLMPDVIRKGQLYKVLTPLYIIKTSKKTYYCINKDERDKALKEIGKTKYELIRAKGLGETGVSVLHETGMNPQTRRYLQITLEDVERAKNMLETVMGVDVQPRKDWLVANPYRPIIED